MLRCADELAERNADFADVLAGMQRALHDVAMAQTVGGEVAASVEPFVQRMSPEDVQLFYEIALRGSRDLQFAPDPRVGFEMTLIRMLVFAPETGPSGGTRAVVRSRKTDAPVTAASAQQEEAPPVASGARSAEPAKEEPAPDLNALIERMQPSGVTRMVFDNCQLAAHANGRWQLVLAEEHEVLLREDSRASVQDLVSEYMGREVRVEIVIGKPEGETPGERRRRLDAARQRDAERAVASDETVQSLLRVFDGRVGSVQPLD